MNQETLQQIVSQIEQAREAQDRDTEAGLAKLLMQKLGLDAFQIAQPGDFYVMSSVKPGENYRRRFMILTFMLYCQFALDQLSDPQHPKHMTAEKIEAVKEFLYKLFVFKPDVDIGSIANKEVDAASFADYKERAEELSKDDVLLQNFPGIALQGRRELIKQREDGHSVIEIDGKTAVMPSINSLLNWEQFESSNFDFLREATNLVEFNDPLLEEAHQIHKTFPTLNAAKAFAEKHRDYPLGLHVGRCGTWHIQTPCTENMKTIDFLGQKTKIIADMLESNAQQLKQHSDLVKNFAKSQVRQSEQDKQDIEQLYKKIKDGDIF